MFLNTYFFIVGFFQTQEESVLCTAGCCVNPLADKDGIEIQRCKKTTIEEALVNTHRNYSMLHVLIILSQQS